MSQSSAHRPRVEALVGEQLRMGERVARIRVDGGQRGLADRAVVRVRDAQPVPVDLRDGASTRCGRTRRISRLMSQRSSMLGVTRDRRGSGGT
jgi:hypothetical protein